MTSTPYAVRRRPATRRDGLRHPRRARGAVATRVTALAFAIGAAATGAAAGPGRSVSHDDLTAKGDAAAFHACAGTSHAGKNVHLHLPADRIHDAPIASFRAASGRRYLIFANGKVPLVAPADDVHLRKARQRTRRGDQICVKGKVGAKGSDGGEGCVLRLHKIKKAP